MFGMVPKDIIVLVSSENAVIERRVSSSWTISTLRSKLEPVTGIPPSAQNLSYQPPDMVGATSLGGFDEDTVLISTLNWRNYTKLFVEDARPATSRENFTDVSQVEKYEMPEEDYAKLSDSVLAWKKRNQLGRFDPKKNEANANKHLEDQSDVESRGITVGARCIVGDAGGDRRGEIAYVGLVETIPQGGIWIGVRLDEPTGKNDGTMDGKRFFIAGINQGIFVRPSRVMVGEYPPVSILMDEDEDGVLEEI
ncbi:hypothetical protein H072_811 [Dactylellina haptotyla CBS 200.50]|uniref:CAP-Gly domain-containing protein n=1 Tax=Dactylellina haptotyla (strain CBS 200.50) TaxID=1284197 RepID=S8AW70_DACHA|nr:hypothetical protein H072_811 [Dactylellina haptotyla CBS 200.50]